MLSFIAGGKLSQHHKKTEQKKRDIRAEKILTAVKENNIPDYSLYLRAFETTGRMSKESVDPMIQNGFDPRDDTDQQTYFETELAKAVENYIPLTALGRPGEQMGAGRILSTEEDWKEDLALLGKGACIIFLLPSAKPGTLWEIDWLI